MSAISWTSDLEIGIPVIDGQHRRIFRYLEQLRTLDNDDPTEIRAIIDELVDYTFSHFGFEETLMEEAGYEAAGLHRTTHDAFRRRVEELRARHAAQGVPVAELCELLEYWLLQHIREDDGSYAPLVKEWMGALDETGAGGRIRAALTRLFGAK